ncbi:centromere/kinetochore protein zw10 homolog [Diadema setosum]|uniref:centromere/kinetochore protein zw10 homolog n=1 Tax=Diadema setosum TaxID=31175 RepID=UPI003B3B7919
MASLVTEVLMNTGLLEKEDLATRIDKVSTQINELKTEINLAQRQRYVDLTPSMDNIGKLHARVKSLDAEMQDLSNKLQGDISVKLRTSTSDVQELTKEMDKSNATIAVLVSLCEVHKNLKEFHSVLKTEEFIQAASLLDSLERHLNFLFRSGLSDMKIVQALTSEERILRETLYYHLGESWSKTIQFKPSQKGQKKVAKVEGHSQLDVNLNDKFASTLQAMQTTRCLARKLEGFSKQFLEYVMLPIVKRPDTEVIIDTSKQKTEVRIVTMKGKSSHPAPESVYEGVLKVLKALSTPFFSHMVRQGDREEEMQSVSLMSMLGSLIWPTMSEAIIKDCLTPSIPATNKQLDEYKDIFEATQKFEQSLQELGFIPDRGNPLTDFGKNVNIHFANKRCQELLVEARRLLQQELHNMVEVGQMKPAAEEAGSPDEKNPLGPGIAAFPRCSISQSVQRLVNLCYETLHEASSSKELCFQLFYTVRNMLELFCEAVPHYHKGSLSQLPQVAGLHHNNCMYISHHLLTLGHRYRHTFPSPLSDGASTFVDLVPVFRQEAVSHFLAQMRSQRDLLLESLSGAGGFARVAESENVTSSNQAIKQVLHRLNHLKAVWGEVLPASVYTKTMATLINTVLMHIVEQICVLEDISADDAFQLHLILVKLKDGTPDLLTPTGSQEPVTVEVVVKEWTAFTELLFILEASMQAIVDRWADGKGPLALVFPATTVKSLIRALFQNTDRRANALSKIKQT